MEHILKLANKIMCFSCYLDVENFSLVHDFFTSPNSMVILLTFHNQEIEKVKFPTSPNS